MWVDRRTDARVYLYYLKKTNPDELYDGLQLEVDDFDGLMCQTTGDRTIPVKTVGHGGFLHILLIT